MTNTVLVALTIVAVLTVLLIVLRLRQISIQGLILGIIGAIIGLLIGALASVPLGALPEPYGGLMPFAVTVVITFIMIVIVVSRRDTLLHVFPMLKQSGSDVPSSKGGGNRVLVDTSVIIDGRIADIAAAGFAPTTLIVPRFVLAELQNIADSEDAMRRGRGRRGLEVLNRLREVEDLTVEITEEDAPQIREVDAKLVALAQRLKCNVLTTDYNLNRVAAIQGVRVLNVNELSNAIRPVVLPGEELLVRVVQPGKERDQGVGYLADGTMIVVDHGDKLIGQEVATEVTRVFQTVAGKMIFAVPRRVDGSIVTAPIAPSDPTTDPSAEITAEHHATKPPRQRNQSRGSRNRSDRSDKSATKPAQQNRQQTTEDRLIELNQSDLNPK